MVLIYKSGSSFTIINKGRWKMEKTFNQTCGCRNVLACGNTGGYIEEVEDVKETKTKEERNKKRTPDSFPVWKERRHKRSQHPGFC